MASGISESVNGRLMSDTSKLRALVVSKVRMLRSKTAPVSLIFVTSMNTKFINLVSNGQT